MDEVATARNGVAAGHAAVARGWWGEAERQFIAAHAALAAVFGPDHPEVVEVAEDLVAVLEMAGVAAFREDAGIRDPGEVPAPHASAEGVPSRGGPAARGAGEV